MTTTTRRAQSQERRDRVVEAALAVVDRVGPEALTHRLVAAEAGVSLSATTYWFASKQELVVEAMRLAAARDAERLDASRRAAAGWSRATIAGELTGRMREQLTCGRTALVADYGLWMAAARQPELREISTAWTAAWEEFLAAVLRAVGAADPERDAVLLGAMLDGLTLRELTAESPASDAELERLLDRQLAALLGERPR